VQALHAGFLAADPSGRRLSTIPELTLSGYLAGIV
jgi:hypothetical protein